MIQETTTPLAFGVGSGEGWHLDQPRLRRTAAWSALAVVAVLLLGVVALTHGHPVASLFTVPLAFAFGALPFERLRPRLPAGLYAGDLGHGLLFPAFPMRTTTIASLGILGASLLLIPVAAVQGVVFRDVNPGALPLSLLPLLLGLLLVGGAYGGLRARRRPSNGLLLTPTGLVLGGQRLPTRVPWEGVERVRPHWTTAALQRRSLISRRGDVVDNWMTFVAAPDDVTGPSPLAVLAGTHEPTVKAEQLAVEPTVVLAVCRFYLAHPEARDELTTTAATDRVASLGRGL